MNSLRFQNCIFDLYGTLVDIHTDEGDPGLWEKLALFYGYYNASYTPDELRIAFHRTVSALEAGQTRLRRDAHECFPEIPIEEAFARLYREKGVEADLPLAVHTGQFFRVLSTEYIRLYDGAIELLRRLRAAGRGVYLLSNAQQIFTAYEVRALGLFPLFDAIYLSSACGCRKPDAAFFRLLLKEQRIAPETAVMIGNDGVTDIGGAKAVGLSTVYIRSNISPQEPLPEADFVLERMNLARVGEILLREQ